MDVASTLAIHVGLELDLLVQGTCKTTRALPSPTLIWYINRAPVTRGKAQKKIGILGKWGSSLFVKAVSSLDLNFKWTLS